MSAVIPILMYHQIDEPPPHGSPMRSLVVRPASFARQMRWLRRLGYRGLSMRELEPYLQGQARGRVFGITFDDGYANNLEHALPILRAEGFTATCYVLSDLAGSTNVWDEAKGIRRAALMDRAGWRAWEDAGMEVGAHGRRHLDLTTLDDRAADDEIAGARRALQQILGAEIRHFCYPYGRFGPRDRELAHRAGFATATTTRRGRARPGEDPLTLPRITVARHTSLVQLWAKLATRYEDRRG